MPDCARRNKQISVVGLCAAEWQKMPLLYVTKDLCAHFFAFLAKRMADSFVFCDSFFDSTWRQAAPLLRIWCKNLYLLFCVVY